LLRRNLLYLHLIHLIRRIARRRHAPSRPQRCLRYRTSSNIAVLVRLVIHHQLVPITSSSSIGASGILKISGIAAKCLRINRLGVVSAEVQLFQQFLFFLSLLLYDLASSQVGLKLTWAYVGLLQRGWRWDGVSGWVQVGGWLGLRWQGAVMLNRVTFGFGGVVVVHRMWKIGHLSLEVFGGTCCRSSVVQLLAGDVIEYLHLPSFCSQAHLPVAVHWSLRCRI